MDPAGTAVGLVRRWFAELERGNPASTTSSCSPVLSAKGYASPGRARKAAAAL